jgi:hypothetical protein
MGVAHAPQAACSAAAAARTAEPAAQNAAGARLEAADQQEDRAAMVVKKVMPAVDSLIDSCVTQGNGAPEFWFPHPVPPARVQTRATREGKSCPCDSRAYGC